MAGDDARLVRAMRTQCGDAELCRAASVPLAEFQAARAEDAATLIMDDGNADYLPFKQQTEQFEFHAR